MVAAVEQSYNRISIDGDTSTNDTVLVLANGLAGNAEIVDEGPVYTAFVEALTATGRELAQAIVRDGEGVTKFVTVHVHGADVRCRRASRRQHRRHQPAGQDRLLWQ